MKHISLTSTTYKKGFSLLEMLISISIFAVISAVVLFNYSKYDNSLVITNLAYQVALAVRQSQVYGLSVKGQGTDFDSGYGTHFDINDPKSIYFYADIEGNSIYDPSYIPAEIQEKIDIQGNNSISRLCVTNVPDNSNAYTDSSFDCSGTGDVQAIDVVYKRPNPEAIIKVSPSGVTYKEAKIFLTSPQGKQKVVTVDFTGQISITDN